MIEVEVEETEQYYFFETNETVKECPKCKKEYRSRQYCLDCYKNRKEKVETRVKVKEHCGKLTKDLGYWNCSCIFGSWFRWGKHWQVNHPKSICKHAKAAIREIKSQKL